MTISQHDNSNKGRVAATQSTMPTASEPQRRRSVRWPGEVENALLSLGATALILTATNLFLLDIRDSNSVGLFSLVGVLSFVCCYLLAHGMLSNRRAAYFDGLILEVWQRYLPLAFVALGVMVFVFPKLGGRADAQDPQLVEYKEQHDSFTTDSPEDVTGRGHAVINIILRTQQISPQTNPPFMVDTPGSNGGDASGSNTDWPVDAEGRTIIAYVPAEERKERTQTVREERRTEITRRFSEGRFGIGDFFAPLAPVLNLLGIGTRRTEYREVTFETIHRIYEGQNLSPEQEQSIVAELNELTPAQRQQWMQHMFELIYDMNKSPEDTQNAKRLITQLVNSSGGIPAIEPQQTGSQRAEELARNIVEEINRLVGEAANNTLTAEMIRTAVGDRQVEASPTLLNLVKTHTESLSGHQTAWDEYEDQHSASATPGGS